MKLLILSLFPILFSGCIKISDPEQDPPSAEKSAASVVAMPEANRYQVNLPVVEGAQLYQRRKVQTDKDTETKALPIRIRSSQLIDEAPEAGSDYVYEAGYIEAEEFIVLQAFKITIPLDLLIDRPVSLAANTNWTRYSRIFFTSAGMLTTNGFNLIIRSDEIFSDAGTIQTFPNSAKASLGSVGRHGGSLEFHFRNTSGSLTVFLRGESGGAGKDGEPFFGPANTSRCIDDINYNPNGERGRRGQDGRRGGNSGALSVSVEEKNLMAFQVFREAGVGGEGGSGGLGQPGSLPRGKYQGNSVCSPLSPPGTDGAMGSPGSTGPTGERDKFCLQAPGVERCE